MLPRNIVTGHDLGNNPFTPNNANWNYHGEIIDRVNRSLDYLTKLRSRNFHIRCILRFPRDGIYPEDNSNLKLFLRYLSEYAYFKPYNPFHIWVRESSHNLHGDCRCHYHLNLFLSGRITRNIHNHLPVLERYWSLSLGLDPSINHGLVEYCVGDGIQHNGIMLDRNSSDFNTRMNEVYSSLLYIAKAVSKQGKPVNCHSFGSSNIR